MSAAAQYVMQQQFQKTEEIRHAINADDMKRAIKLAQKLDRNDLAKAMLAFCYNRTGRRDEALELCDALGSVALNNDSVMHWISYVYSYSRRLDVIAKLKAQRLQLAPSTGEMFFHFSIDCLFALAKTYDFAECDVLVKKIMAANRASARPVMDVAKLSIWAATFGFLRAQKDDPKDLQLALAASFLEKSQTPATAGLPLKRWIQVRRHLAAQALDSLAFLPNESNASKLWMRALLIQLNGATTAVEDEFKVLCSLVEERDSADDFRAWSRLCRLAVASKSDELVQQLRELIGKQVQLPLRGPQLAACRLELELFLKATTTDGGKVLKDQLVAFVKRFSDLNHVVFSDLKNDLVVFCLPSQLEGSRDDRVGLPIQAQICAFLLPSHEYVALDRESRTWPIEAIPARTSSEVRQELFNELLPLQGNVQVKQILRYCGAYEDYSHDQLMELAQPGLDLNAKDEEVLFSAHVLQDAYCINKDENLLLLSAAVLEERMGKNPDNFEVKLALHELYSFRLGAPLCGLPAYAMLRIKQIQCDALGHLSLANLSNYGFFAEARMFALGVLEVNSKSRTECADSFATAFEHCEISSPVEMYRLELRLKDSLQFHLSVVERAHLSLLPQPDENGEGVLSRVNVEVNNLPKGKSQICVAEHRLAVTFPNRHRLHELVWNADFNVEYTCDAAFGKQFHKQLEGTGGNGPNARIARELLASKQALSAWRLRELQWAEVRTSAACVLADGETTPEQVQAVGDLVRALIPSQQQPKPVGLLWEFGLAMLQVLGSKSVPDSLFELLGQVEAAWSEAGLESTKQTLVDVSVSLSHAGVWAHAVVAKLASLGKKSAFDSAKVAKLQSATSKLFQKVAQALRELGRETEKQGHDDTITSRFELFAVFQKVQKSRTESANRLRQLAQTLSVF
ncbi:hypothetical protein BASA81_003258 [Batrachochytrium salamandrivorans]|nr:hypothetical protein BASA81_003258 [Batrachochytrium salamandrivorans]